MAKDETLPEIDLYELLGCNENSSYESLRESYIGLIKKFHPDLAPRGLVKIATSISQELNLAKCWLLNPEMRERYNGQYRRIKHKPSRLATFRKKFRVDSISDF